jgi:hypothetical protein
MMKYFLSRDKISYCFAAFLLIFCGSSQAQLSTAFNEYLQAILDENWQKAESCWFESDIEKSKRLGIIYDDVNAKYDCASPLFNILDELRRGSVQFAILDSTINNGIGRLDISFHSAQDTLAASYYLADDNNDWKLCSSLYAITQGWKVRQTKYTRVHYDDPVLINEYALAEMDRFIERLLSEFKIPEERKKHLEKAKVDYYLVNQPQIIKITGHDIQGVTDLPLDAVISKYLPHTHELVHLLINYSLQELPLYTLPAVQEGVACCFGGRWGKSPEVINYWGNVSLNFGLGGLDGILTFDGFHRGIGNPDVAYALSSLFIKSLVNDHDINKLMEFYRNVSGRSDQVQSITADEVKSIARKAFQVPWARIENEFANTVNDFKYGGIIPCQPPDQAPDSVFSMAGNSISIWDIDDSYIFQISTDETFTGGVILFNDIDININQGYKSWLFAEQIPAYDYNGEMFGIQFSADEVGLYNYFTNILLAKYVAGFTPDENFRNQAEKSWRFSFKKELIAENIFSYGINFKAY